MKLRFNPRTTSVTMLQGSMDAPISIDTSVDELVNAIIASRYRENVYKALQKRMGVEQQSDQKPKVGTCGYCRFYVEDWNNPPTCVECDRLIDADTPKCSLYEE